MNKLVSAFLIGGVFGLGIAISGMANPAKILNFFDLAGAWDPSLAFVMAGGLAVAFIGYRLVFASREGAGLRGRIRPADAAADRPRVGRRRRDCSASAGALPASVPAAPFRRLGSATRRRRSSWRRWSPAS